MSRTVQAPSFDGYLTVKEVALRYPVTVAQLNGWRAKGEGPSFVRVGKRILYPVATTAAWFEGLEEQSSDSSPDLGEEMTAAELAAGLFLQELGELLDKHHQGYHAMLNEDPEVLLRSALLLSIVQLYDQADRGYGRLVALAELAAEANPEGYGSGGGDRA